MTTAQMTIVILFLVLIVVMAIKAHKSATQAHDEAQALQPRMDEEAITFPDHKEPSNTLHIGSTIVAKYMDEHIVVKGINVAEDCLLVELTPLSDLPVFTEVWSLGLVINKIHNEQYRVV